jgi:hypothetical protein
MKESGVVRKLRIVRRAGDFFLMPAVVYGKLCEFEAAILCESEIDRLS